MTNALYSLEESISAIRAFNEMLAAAAYQGDSLKEISGGMHLLLGTQVDILAAADEALRNQISDLKKQVQELSINLIPNSIAEKSGQTDPRELRATFIYEKVDQGYDAGEIANALNLKKETVEKVVRQLLTTRRVDALQEVKIG